MRGLPFDIEEEVGSLIPALHDEVVRGEVWRALMRFPSEALFENLVANNLWYHLFRQRYEWEVEAFWFLLTEDMREIETRVRLQSLRLTEVESSS